MEEIFDICDRVTVFRDGKYIDTTDVASVTRAQLVKMMVGRDMGSENYHKDQPVPENTVLEVKNFTDADNHFKNINFKLNKGEILGLARTGRSRKNGACKSHIWSRYQTQWRDIS
mgnify:CR=1 FL=1